MAARRLKYPAETPAKALIRRRCFAESLRYWEHHGRPLGDAVVLCGDEPREMSGLISLGFLPEMCWVVDRELPGLDVTRRLWPSAKIFHGNIQYLLPRLRRISFLNLDLMGCLGEEAEECLRLAAPSLMKGALLAYTFTCGHEFKHFKIFPRLVATGEVDKQEQRWALLRSILQDILGDVDVVFHTTYRHHSYGGNTMGTILVAKK